MIKRVESVKITFVRVYELLLLDDFLNSSASIFSQKNEGKFRAAKFLKKLELVRIK